ncbi:MAG: tandem-95 repeat protein, partial [Chryseolinea sp.]
VHDSDNVYPDDFTMTIQGGANYIVNNLTITPAAGFTGQLSVPVTVNDGQISSDPFNVTITVNETPNHIPEITGQAPLSTFVSVPITIRVTALTINDPDNTFPDDFTLKVYPGVGYTFNGTTITPNLLFIGTLSVNITVNDGKNESAQYKLKVDVNLVPNAAPKITDQNELSTFVNQPITINFTDLTVEDPDNVYPTGFKMTLYNGSNYAFSTTTVTPANNFEGTLTVPVSVNDGVNESGKFNLKIAVTTSPNTVPQITGQVRDDYNIDEDKTFQITLDMLSVADADNAYPKDFTLKIAAPDNDAKYTVIGDKVTPNANYNGSINIPLVVNDGKADSNPYVFKLMVNPVNDPPQIVSQKPLTTFAETPIELTIDQLVISDVDNASGFILKIIPGGNYKLDGNTITPIANFLGELKVSVSVSDGTASTPYEMVVRVLNKPNIPPVITGQRPDPLIAIKNTELPITINQLLVTDDQTSTGFPVKIYSGTNYTIKGSSILPASNYVGPLTVPVSVNDGIDESNKFNLNVNVIPPSSKPTIIGQNPIASDEDIPVTIALSDLLVTDTDDVYPKGFSLQILPGTGYASSGTTVTPAKDFNGFLLVSVTVTDKGGSVSNPYGLALLVRPVDDAPVITQFETNDLSYEPGKDPIIITSIFEVKDIDNDNLSFAEVGVDHRMYKKGYDQLLFQNTANIRGIFDADSGKLSLIGYASIQEYQDAIRSIKYNYDLNETEPGQPSVLPANKTVYFFVHDGQKASQTVKRKIIMETNVSIKIPTAFSPNDDNVNETWQVIALSNAEQCENAVIRVYDKRGLLLFQSVGIDKQWDGKYNGQLLPTDTYYYTVDLMLTYAKKTYKGAVAIVR